MNAEKKTNQAGTKKTCAEGQCCGTGNCGQGICPGMILAAVFFAGWGIYHLGIWIWGMLGH